MGGDPHFSVLLHDKKTLCYSVQGKANSVFNLISSNDYLLNAKFVPDSKRRGVTWMGTVGVVFHKPLQYGSTSAKVTHIKMNARDRTIQIGDTINFNATAIERVTSENGNISITRRSSRDKTHHPAVTICLNDINLHFTVKFEGEHLDMIWHKPIESGTSHGLIGELSASNKVFMNFKHLPLRYNYVIL